MVHEVSQMLFSPRCPSHPAQSLCCSPQQTPFCTPQEAEIPPPLPAYARSRAVRVEAPMLSYELIQLFLLFG